MAFSQDLTSKTRIFIIIQNLKQFVSLFIYLASNLARILGLSLNYEPFPHQLLAVGLGLKCEQFF